MSQFPEGFEPDLTIPWAGPFPRKPKPKISAAKALQDLLRPGGDDWRTPLSRLLED